MHVYLNSLVEDLKLLWDQWVEVFDGFANKPFQMHAMLFCTNNDFLVYENLSRYNVKGDKTCPIYGENTSYEQFKHKRKTMYLQQCRFLNQCHRYCILKKSLAWTPKT